MRQNRRGNVLLYVLIGVALMAALAFAISRDSGGQQINRLSKERTELLGVELMTHMAATEQAVFQMTQFGLNYDDLLFDRKDDEDFDTNRTRQVFHPSGGGINEISSDGKDLFDPAITAPRKWKVQNQTNIEWSASTASDLIYSIVDIHPELCAFLNKKITGSDDIPNITSLNINNVFTTDGSNTDLTADLCPECENKRALCIRNNDAHVFYYIIGSR